MGQTPDTNDTAPTKNTTVPFALETAAAWSWRPLGGAGAEDEPTDAAAAQPAQQA